jgi:hypothetical protein
MCFGLNIMSYASIVLKTSAFIFAVAKSTLRTKARLNTPSLYNDFKVHADHRR